MSIYIELYKGDDFRPGNFVDGIVVVVMNTRKNIRGTSKNEFLNFCKL